MYTRLFLISISLVVLFLGVTSPWGDMYYDEGTVNVCNAFFSLFLTGEIIHTIVRNNIQGRQFHFALVLMAVASAPFFFAFHALLHLKS